MKYSILFSCIYKGERKEGYTNVTSKNKLILNRKVEQKLIQLIQKDRKELEEIKIKGVVLNE